MSQTLTPVEKEILQRINEILIHDWDPIGISDDPKAKNEYESYAPMVFKNCQSTNPDKDTADYLSKIQTQEMGLPSVHDDALKIAQLLIREVETIKDKYKQTMNTSENNPRAIETIRFPDPVPYNEAYDQQIARRNALENGQATNALFLLQHTRTFTMGRSAHEEHLLHSRDDLAQQGIQVCDVDRGGDVTYHGPGQLVAYPILNLEHWEKSVQWYLRTLEDTLIDTLAHYGLKGERIPKFTGVWVNGAKIAAIGIGIHKWHTYHGIALNLDPQMDDFKLIIPCGIQNKPVTSLSQLLDEPPSMDELMDVFEGCFRKQFQHPI